MNDGALGGHYEVMLLAAVLVTIPLLSAHFDKWMMPRPTLFQSPNRLYGMLDNPPKYYGPTAKSKATVFICRGGKRAALWARILVNEPAWVLLSNAGDVASIDQYGELGAGQVVVLYGGRGQTLRAYKLDELFTQAEISGFDRSVSSTHWVDYERTKFTQSGPGVPWMLQVSTKPTRSQPLKSFVLRFDAKTGRLVEKRVVSK